MQGGLLLALLATFSLGCFFRSIVFRRNQDTSQDNLLSSSTFSHANNANTRAPDDFSLGCSFRLIDF